MNFTSQQTNQINATLMNTTKRKLVPILTTAVAALLVSQVSSLAALTFDLRITARSSGLPVDPKFLTNAQLNEQISITIYADLTGATANAGFEGIAQTYLSLVSGVTTGSILGDFSTATVNPAFGAAATRGGTPRDTNTDGFMDRLGVGTTTAAQNTAASSDIVALTAGLLNYAGTPIADGQRFTIATAVFTVKQLGSGLTVSVIPSIFTSGVGAARFTQIWAEDAATTTSASNRQTGFQNLGNVAPNTGVASFPSSNMIGVPEPSAFGMVLLGSMGLLGFKRMGARKLS